MFVAGACLFDILCDWVLLKELCTFPSVELFCIIKEVIFKVLFVDTKNGALQKGRIFIEAQLNWNTQIIPDNVIYIQCISSGDTGISVAL